MLVHAEEGEGPYRLRAYIILQRQNSRGIRFVFQFDAKLKGVLPSGMWWDGIFENRFQVVSCLPGTLAGADLAMKWIPSSSDREFSRNAGDKAIARYLMRVKETGRYGRFAMCEGKIIRSSIWRLMRVFLTGQGINAAGNLDNTKDFIGRILPETL